MVQAICRVSAVYSDGLVFSSQARATLRSPPGGRGVVACGCQFQTGRFQTGFPVRAVFGPFQ